MLTVRSAKAPTSRTRPLNADDQRTGQTLPWVILHQAMLPNAAAQRLRDGTTTKVTPASV
jgi:hypothetical protein